MSKEKDIYKLLLHESKVVEDGFLLTTALRVPGGFFYRSFDKSNSVCCGVFVPFDNEFQDEDEATNGKL